MDLFFGIFTYFFATILAPQGRGDNCIPKQNYRFMFWYSKKVLSKILQYVPFLVLKTIKTDIYGRYLADVFLAEKLPNDKSKLTIELDVQNIADRIVLFKPTLIG